jgi:hypothetical protein
LLTSTPTAAPHILLRLSFAELQDAFEDAVEALQRADDRPTGRAIYMLLCKQDPEFPLTEQQVTSKWLGRKKPTLEVIDGHPGRWLAGWLSTDLAY